MTICNCYDVVFLSVLPGSIKLHTLYEKRCVDTYLHFKVWCFDGIPFNRKDDISNGPYVSIQKRKKKKKRARAMELPVQTSNLHWKEAQIKGYTV